MLIITITQDANLETQTLLFIDLPTLVLVQEFIRFFSKAWFLNSDFYNFLEVSL